MIVNKKYNYLLVSIGLLLLIQACTSEPKLQIKSILTRNWKAPSLEHWQNGVTTTVDGHIITRSSREDGLHIITSYNRAGHRDGLFGRYTKGHSAQDSESRYKNGLRHGMSRIYGIDTPYVDGVKEGVEREFKPDSFMVRSTPYYQGKKNGVEQKFNYIRGNLEKRITYSMDTKKKIEYYCKGKVSFHAEMDGCRHGLQEEWYCGTDKLKTQTPYRFCKRDGTKRVYDGQGHLTYKIPYRNDLKEGMVKGYYPNGKLKYEVTYHADKVNEVGYYYLPDGTKERIDYDTIMSFDKKLPTDLKEWQL